MRMRYSAFKKPKVRHKNWSIQLYSKVGLLDHFEMDGNKNNRKEAVCAMLTEAYKIYREYDGRK